MRRSWKDAKEQLSEELEAHLQLAIADRVANGEEPAEARAAALRELGNVPLIRDVTREQWGWTWLENLFQDFRYSLRQLRRSPAFTITALLTLAFGIGANLGVFQLLYAVVLADLPVPRPAEVVRVQAARSPFDQSWTISYPAYQRLRQATPDVPLMATSFALVHWASNRNTVFTLDLHPNLPLVVLGVSLMMVSLISFSVVPALLFLRSGIAQTAGSRARVAGNLETARQRLRSNILLSTQVSLSLLLSTMSACFAATLVHWQTIDVGMDREHVLTVRPEFHQLRYTDRPELLPNLYSRIQTRLEALPGVRSAAVAMCGGIHCGWVTALYVRGRNNLTDGQVHGQEDHVGLGFFSTMGIPFLRGRDFATSDTMHTQAVAIRSSVLR